MIAKKFLRLVDVAKTQVLCIYESSKVIMVSENNDLVFAIF